jgi:hypothetical protein
MTKKPRNITYRDLKRIKKAGEVLQMFLKPPESLMEKNSQ